MCAFSKFFQQLSSESLRNRAKHDRIDGTATTDAIAAPEVQTRLTNNLLDREDDDRSYHYK